MAHHKHVRFHIRNISSGAASKQAMWADQATHRRDDRRRHGKEPRQPRIQERAGHACVAICAAGWTSTLVWVGALRRLETNLMLCCILLFERAGGGRVGVLA